MSGDVIGAIVDTIREAEHQARIEHDEGRCHLSEWSCSWCEVEAS